jgi:cerevisin
MLVRYFTLIVYGIRHAFANPLASIPHEPRQQFTLAPVFTADTQHVINNSYIVILNPGIDSQSLITHLDFLQFAEAKSPLANEFDGSVKHVYDGPKMKGYAGIFSDATLEHIRAQPEVEYIEQDQMVWAFSRELQRSAPWVNKTTVLLIHIYFNKYCVGPGTHKPS